MLKKVVAVFVIIVALLSFTACNNKSESDSDKENMLTSYTYETQELHCNRAGLDIFGIAYIPQTESKVPLVIFSHEIGSTHNSGTEYARWLASHGIAAYTFDFCGGSHSSRSDGNVRQMSVMTEASDLESVIDTAKTWEFVDTDKIVLLGASQGGMVSAVAAVRRADELKGLMLIYPAFVIQDDLYEMFSSKDDVPASFSLFGWMTVGGNYATDVWDYDLYGEMKNFTKSVLIIHGDRDDIVPLSYSERAAESYPDAKLITLHGAGHGFYGGAFRSAISEIEGYIDLIGLLK